MRFRATDPTVELTLREGQRGLDRPGVPAAPSGPTYDDGFSEGWRAREVQAVQELAGLGERVELLSQDLPEALNLALKQLEEQFHQAVCTMAFALAEVIIKREVRQETIVQAVMGDALALLTPGEQPVLRVHPEDARMLAEHAQTGGIASLQIVADPALQPGDVLLACRDGFVDGTVRSRISELQQYVANRLIEGESPDVALR